MGNGKCEKNNFQFNNNKYSCNKNNKIKLKWNDFYQFSAKK